MVKLLVIDPEINTRLLFRDEFQKAGYQVTVVETPRDALKVAQRCMPDVILIEINKNISECVEFLKKIETGQWGVSVVVCSAFVGYKYDVRLRDCEAFVVRSADFTELKMIVKDVASQKRPFPKFKGRGSVSRKRLVPGGLANRSWKVS